MGRSYSFITETLSEIEQLLDNHRGIKNRQRLELLRVLKSQGISIKEACEIVGCCDRTARRWLRCYKTGGVEAILDRCKEERSTEQAERSSNDGSPRQALLCLLNSLPMSADPVQWIEGMRSSLKAFFQDVDEVYIGINISCSLELECGSVARVTIAEHQRGGAGGSSSTLSVRRRRGSRGSALVEDMRQQGFPLERYQPPLSVDYHLDNGTYLGTIILMRQTGRPAISPRTLETLDSIRRFIVFLLSDCLARRRQEAVDASTFNRIIQAIMRNADLTNREREVLVHRLLGKQQDDIARELNIAPETVVSHLKSIRSKSGVRTDRELLARYATPLADRQRGRRGGGAPGTTYS